MTPREYFDFVGAIRDMPAETVDERTKAWAERLGFAAKLDTLSSNLSRGQQQKVMLAGAFFHEPAVVFIDEPVANLDPIVQEPRSKMPSDVLSLSVLVGLRKHLNPAFCSSNVQQ